MSLSKSIPAIYALALLMALPTHADEPSNEVVSAEPAHARRVVTPAPLAEHPSATLPGDMRQAIRDPQTGQRLQAAPTGHGASAALARQKKALFTRQKGAYREVPSTGPAGGFKLQLNGRVRHALTAHQDPDGIIRQHCAHETDETCAHAPAEHSREHEAPPSAPAPPDRPEK